MTRAYKASYGMALCLNGRKEEGEKFLNKSLDEYITNDPRDLIEDKEVRIAAIYAFLGNKQKAYHWLNESDWTYAALYDIQQDYLFSNMREEKTFQDLINSIRDDRKAIREEIAQLKAAGEWEI